MFLMDLMKSAGRVGKDIGYNAPRATITGAAYAARHPVKAAGKAGWWGTKQTAGAAWSGTKLGAQAGFAGTKMLGSAAMKYGPGVYRKSNAFSKVAFGASVPEIAAVSGLGLATFASLSNNPLGQAQSAGRFVQAMGQEMKMQSRPTYGSTTFQQSTQGLTFGLHSRRTR